MNKLNSLPFPISLNAMAHQIAQEFYQHQSNPQKAKQVYLNTLAVYAVNHYLNSLNIQTNLENSNSWNTVMQTLSNVADLTVKNRGKVECRPVLPDSDFCHIPAEVWLDRIGYIAVQLNPELTEAKLLGFTSKVTNENLPLNQLQPLENLIILLSEPIELTPVDLSQWKKNIFDPLWQPIEALLTPNLAYSFMADNLTTISRGKRFNLGMHFQNKKVDLLVMLTPKNEITEIQVQLRPVGEDQYLPTNLKLALLTETNRVIQEVKARSNDYLIQLDKFGYRAGRKFRIKISLDGDSITQEMDHLWRTIENFWV